MARVKVSEYQAKKLLSQELGLAWKGLSATSKTTTEEILKVFPQEKLVVKVDQGVKKRGKQGLVKVNLTPAEAISFIKEHPDYQSFLVEPMFAHEKNEEHYLSLERVREGVKTLYSDKGGIDVEENWESVTDKIPTDLKDFVKKLSNVFEKYNFSFLEINPLVVSEEGIAILDGALQVDDALLGNFEPIEEKGKSKLEKTIEQLDKNTPASLKCKLVNPDGSIWMLLSGGGASLVLADEVADQGFGKELGNYGEYSGSPSTEDTYLYTKAVIEALASSKAPKKVLIIAGGVANFTDIAKTFKGVIQALDEEKSTLQSQNVKVFVRRGGPNQRKGLALMETFLFKNNLLGYIKGPEVPLTDVVDNALVSLEKNNA